MANRDPCDAASAETPPVGEAFGIAQRLSVPAERSDRLRAIVDPLPYGRALDLTHRRSPPRTSRRAGSVRGRPHRKPSLPTRSADRASSAAHRTAARSHDGSEARATPAPPPGRRCRADRSRSRPIQLVLARADARHEEIRSGPQAARTALAPRGVGRATFHEELSATAPRLALEPAVPLAGLELRPLALGSHGPHLERRSVGRRDRTGMLGKPRDELGRLAPRRGPLEPEEIDRQ